MTNRPGAAKRLLLTSMYAYPRIERARITSARIATAYGALLWRIRHARNLLNSIAAYFGTRYRYEHADINAH